MGFRIGQFQFVEQMKTAAGQNGQRLSLSLDVGFIFFKAVQEILRIVAIGGEMDFLSCLQPAAEKVL